MTKHGASGRSVETSGRTVEQAVEAALARLGRTLEDVEVSVLREPSRGMLGFGAHDAIVRVSERIGDPIGQAVRSTAAATATPSSFVGEPDAVPVAEDEAEDFADEDEAFTDEDEGDDEEETILYDPHQDSDDLAPARELPADREEILEVGREVVVDILQHMTVYGDVMATWTEAQDEQDTPALLLEVVGDDLGILIGRKGETLRDLQYLVRLIVARKVGGSVNIVVDVEEYKARRERTLRQLARRTADRVIATGRAVHMEPMNSYERRIVHLELRGMKGIHTQSSGEGERRKVGIFPGSGRR
jgi:spoIIIJ-associated protein